MSGEFEKRNLSEPRFEENGFLVGIPPFRVQSVEYNTVKISCRPPFAFYLAIDCLDEKIHVKKLKKIFVVVNHQCFSKTVAFEGDFTKKNIIRNIRKSYRLIYQEARKLGVRNQLDSLRSLVVYNVKKEESRYEIKLICDILSESSIS